MEKSCTVQNWNYEVIRMISELCQEFYCLRYISGNLLILSEHMEKIK